MKRFVALAARPLEVLVGAFFLLAAFLKLQNPQLFSIQIHEYQVFADKDLLAPAALFFLTLEMVLGFAMLVGLRPRAWVLGLVQVLLVAFTGLIAYAWLTHGIEDCGCMGEVKMSPAVSIAKNLVLMVLVAWSWTGFALRERPDGDGVLDKAVATLVVGLVTVAASYPDLYRAGEDQRADRTGITEETAPDADADTHAVAPASETAERPFARFSVTTQDGTVHDLASGRYLVAMLSATCDHCMASVPTLNEYGLWEGELPPVVSLNYEPSSGDLEAFRMQANAQFPMHSLGDDFILFSRYIGREPPRLHLVEDGRSLYFWDEPKLPSADRLVMFLESHGELSPVNPGAETIE
ncbi:MAG: MauE/DoxX family redox-associated membrane protein [Candidatus Hydrogenedentota bacterium]